MRLALPTIAVAGLALACGSSLDPARDLTGTWLGTAPNGAFYEDNVANPNCRYAADVRLVLVQDGASLTGSLRLTVRESTKLLNTSLACVPVGAQSTQGLFGEVGSSRANWTLVDGVTVFSGTFTSDLMNGEFVTNAPNGVIGTFTLRRE